MALLDLVVPVMLFAAASLSSPGPNNVMITASGVNFGFRRTIPHMLGIAVGFAVMNLAVGLGLGRVFESNPQIHQVLKYVSVAYLIFLAWKIANAGHVKEGGAQSKPFTFLQAAAFQWVNPKAWAVAVGAVATFTTVGGDLLGEVLLMSLIFLLWTIPSTSIWTFFGTVIGRFLHTPGRLRAFNWFMAGLLLLSLFPAIT
ncbi:LysE family translocator [Magnetovibrio sp.]|uniref:LysE family translocator n=1 Tax=Magnetovibrio sp. TaxID=2024836 RepID=UPI002F93CA25